MGEVIVISSPRKSVPNRESSQGSVQAGLKSAHEAKKTHMLDGHGGTVIKLEADGDKLPWERALAMEKELVNNQAMIKSSVCIVILTSVLQT
jgi:hypothetical protein